jgi:hypothetical protein
LCEADVDADYPVFEKSWTRLDAKTCRVGVRFRGVGRCYACEKRFASRMRDSKRREWFVKGSVFFLNDKQWRFTPFGNYLARLR